MSTTPPVPEIFEARTMSFSLTVKDLQKSLAWYHEVIGFGIVRNIERDGKLRGISLKAGEVRLAINQDDGAKGWDRIKGQGFSISITTDQNIDEIAKRIKEKGGRLTMEPTDMSWGVRSIRMEDPDGYKMAISKPING